MVQPVQATQKKKVQSTGKNIQGKKPVNISTSVQQPVSEKKDKKWIVALLLSIFLGNLGVDRFYMGYIGTGILKLITFGGLGIWWLIDLILIATKHNFAKVNWIE